MGSTSTAQKSADDLWLEIIADDEDDRNAKSRQSQPPIAVVYRRQRPGTSNKQSEKTGNPSSTLSSNNQSRPSLAPNGKRVSWNRSLSARGRSSIAVATYAACQPQRRAPRRKPRPGLPKGKVVQPPNFERERAYFQEVDAFELLEESPSPKKFSWLVDRQSEDVALPPLCTRLEKWLHAKKERYIPSGSLSTILQTPANPGEVLEPIRCNISNSSCTRVQEDCLRSHSGSGSDQHLHMVSEEGNEAMASTLDRDFDETESALRKLSLASSLNSVDGDHRDPFLALMKECGQSGPSTFSDVFSKFCDTGSIVKIGEGTYGEAFIAGNNVCKIVPIDGELRVNGEVQKKSIELLEEVTLSRTLNSLRRADGPVDNATTSFIETKDLRVCQGPYDPALLRAWEDWDADHGSENDHPKHFPEDQCYVVFVLEHGGTDLESFVLLDFVEAWSLLVQVTAALAVAEAAYEFEHRDLHWGNILLSRKENTVLQFTLEGKTTLIKTYGVLISIIDFTLSRLNTGNTILYLDLSSEPEIFEGPRGDKQADTYRKMREVTDECWEESFPKTNVLWLQYLVDVLLLKKTYKRSVKNERDLRSFKKRLNSCSSAKEAMTDPFLSDILIDQAVSTEG